MTAPRETRPASIDDRPAIEAMVRAAFAHYDGAGSFEADVLHKVWALEPQSTYLELVALEGEQLIGHVLCSWGSLSGRPVVGVGPVGVRPDRQRDGWGSLLLEQAIETATADGLDCLLLLGDPRYYSRFGFEPARPLGMTYPPVGPDNPGFQVHLLGRQADPGLLGEYVYSWELTQA